MATPQPALRGCQLTGVAHVRRSIEPITADGLTSCADLFESLAALACAGITIRADRIAEFAGDQ